MTNPPFHPPRRRWLRVSLRALMVLVLLVGGGVGWLAFQIRTQRQAIATIQAAGGTVVYDYENLPPDDHQPPGLSFQTEPAAPRWLRSIMGDELFQSVETVNLTIDRDPSVLAAVAQFDRLETLYLTDNSEADGGYGQLRQLRRIHLLRLAGTGLTDAKLAAIGPMPSLQTCWVVAGQSLLGKPPQVTDAGLARLLAGMPSLHYLGLECGALPLAAAIDGLPRYQPNLAILAVRGTRVTDLDLAAIGRLPQLQTLALPTAAITDAGLTHLGTLAQLKLLDLAGSRVSDAGLVHLTRLPQLSILDLSATRITDAGLPTLARITTLTNLDLGENLGITNASMIPAHFGPKLTTVRLEGTAVTESGSVPRPGLTLVGIPPPSDLMP